MPAAEITSVRMGQFALLELALPGRPVETCGVLVFDASAGDVAIRMRRDWSEIADEHDVEVLRALSDDLQAKSAELGGERLLEYLEDTLSNTLLISGREAVEIHGSTELTTADLYSRFVRSKVLPFRTHLPVFYSLRAAAGSFSPEGDSAGEIPDWLEAPVHLRLRDDMFILRVTGRSMEPDIPDGSLCIFRANPAGSRQGKILLVERIGAFGSELTVKVYRSEKGESPEGEWKHGRITMIPLNPEFPSWTLREGESLRVIAEFVDLL